MTRTMDSALAVDDATTIMAIANQSSYRFATTTTTSSLGTVVTVDLYSLRHKSLNSFLHQNDGIETGADVLQQVEEINFESIVILATQGALLLSIVFTLILKSVLKDCITRKSLRGDSTRWSKKHSSRPCIHRHGQQVCALRQTSWRQPTSHAETTPIMTPTTATTTRETTSSAIQPQPAQLQQSPLQRRVRFDSNNNTVYHDDQYGGSRMQERYQTWYTRSETAQFKCKTLQRIKSIIRHNEGGYVERLESIYKTCNLDDVQGDCETACSLFRLYVGTPDNLELIGLEKYAARSIAKDFNKRRESLFGAMDVVQSSHQYQQIKWQQQQQQQQQQQRVNSFSWPLRQQCCRDQKNAEEIRDACLGYTFQPCLFAQILARAQLAAH
ncbi:hypothetical protein ACA910_000423 [Epithemia clementina (nom. ined.)]